MPIHDVTIPEDVETATLVIRGTDGQVAGSHSVPIDDFREEPADFRITCHSLGARRVAPGEEITVTLHVRNSGFEQGYVAALTANGSAVAETTGMVSPNFDDVIEQCEGSTVKIRHTFDERGRYDFGVRIWPRADGG